MKHADLIEDLEAYLKLLKYTYSLGGPLYITHTSLIQTIRDYIDYLKDRYE